MVEVALEGFADWTKYGAIWVTWWLGDIAGDLIFTPLVLLWGIRWKITWKEEEALEVGALLLLLTLLSAVVFAGWLQISAKNYPIAFICGPIVIWTAFRFTQRETATGIFILSVIAVWGTVRGFGPFVSQNENQSLLTVQSWTAVLAITAMALSAGMAERRRIEEKLQQQKSIVQAANRTKDHFLAMLSHELRTPLTPVISALDSLETAIEQTCKIRAIDWKRYDLLDRCRTDRSIDRRQSSVSRERDQKLITQFTSEHSPCDCRHREISADHLELAQERHQIHPRRRRHHNLLGQSHPEQFSLLASATMASA